MKLILKDNKEPKLFNDEGKELKGIKEIDYHYSQSSLNESGEFTVKYMQKHGDKIVTNVAGWE